MALPQTFDQLVKEAHQKDLYGQLVKQVNKDFLYANINLGFDEDILPSSLKLTLHETVFRLINEKFADYLNLLYIIDVPENKVKLLDGNDIHKLSGQVTFLILQREWQKVWYRAHYS